MAAFLEAEVVTRRSATGHEDLDSQFDRRDSELWNAYIEKFPISEESRSKSVRYIVDSRPDEDHLEELQIYKNARVHSTDIPSRPQVMGTFAEHPIDPSGKFRDFHDYLSTLKVSNLAIGTRATSETSTLVSFLQTAHRAGQPLEESQWSQETVWTDDKNRRRCELVDKEIDGTISPDDRIDLEELQEEMLSYRRTVAPLPLRELRKMHQELLRQARNQTE